MEVLLQIIAKGITFLGKLCLLIILGFIIGFAIAEMIW